MRIDKQVVFSLIFLGLIVLGIFFPATFKIFTQNQANNQRISQSIVNTSNSDYNLTLDEIWIRDPNIIYFNGTYYMTGT
ncbi:MAG: hypothetical protein ACFFD2_31000, partial [Promethearchaeota archaeon]